MIKTKQLSLVPFHSVETGRGEARRAGSRRLCVFNVVLLGALFCARGVSYARQAPGADRVEALIYTTMPSRTEHRPEMAMDGDPKTYYRSVYGMSRGDTFLVLLSHAIPVRSIEVTTGDGEGQGALSGAGLEISADAETFTNAATFDAAGVAKASTDGKPVEALRIRIRRGEEVPALIIREIKINTTATISHVQLGPGRGFFDLSQAPDLTVWANTAERQMEESWADTAALLYSDRFIPPNMVNVEYKTGPGVTGVAATGGGVMTVNSAWCRQHPEDTGLTVHETAHVIQAYSAYNPVWLVEGIADYIRWVRFEPEHFRVRINPNTATYHDSYRTTGAFLAWCELHYDSRLVTKLSQQVRYNTYKTEQFKEYCGRDVDTLWSEFVAAYKADPVNIITPPIAAADRPRVLPTVAAGSSVPVDLSTLFDAVGVTTDQKTFPAASGFDAGGAAYSANLLGPRQAPANVLFNLGPPDARNVLTCKGQEISLPAGADASLWLLGSGVEGAQMAQPITVNYTDGSSDKLYQNFSDWYSPRAFPGEITGLRMAYRNYADGTRDQRPFSVYTYGFPINGAKTVKSLILPANPNLKILAVTLGK